MEANVELTIKRDSVDIINDVVGYDYEMRCIDDNGDLSSFGRQIEKDWESLPRELSLTDILDFFESEMGSPMSFDEIYFITGGDTFVALDFKSLRTKESYSLSFPLEGNSLHITNK